jgi:hypothetical protein
MFRFSIREVFWMTLVVSLAFGWWREHRQITAIKTAHWQADRRLDLLVDQIKREGYAIYEANGGGIIIGKPIEGN